jgi:hypothetical protein
MVLLSSEMGHWVNTPKAQTQSQINLGTCPRPCPCLPMYSFQNDSSEEKVKGLDVQIETEPLTNRPGHRHIYCFRKSNDAVRLFHKNNSDGSQV